MFLFRSKISKRLSESLGERKTFAAEASRTAPVAALREGH